MKKQLTYLMFILLGMGAVGCQPSSTIHVFYKTETLPNPEPKPTFWIHRQAPPPRVIVVPPSKPSPRPPKQHHLSPAPAPHLSPAPAPHVSPAPASRHPGKQPTPPPKNGAAPEEPRMGEERPLLFKKSISSLFLPPVSSQNDSSIYVLPVKPAPSSSRDVVTYQKSSRKKQEKVKGSKPKTVVPVKPSKPQKVVPVKPSKPLKVVPVKPSAPLKVVPVKPSAPVQPIVQPIIL